MLYKPFSKTDPRVKLTLEKPEPLVHFALVCGSKSCPPIKTYSAEVNIKCEEKEYREIFFFITKTLVNKKIFTAW